MKLSGKKLVGYFSRPDTSKRGVLIYGADGMLVSERRKEIVTALIGPEGDKEMRLTRLSGGDLRKDPASLQDATKAVGFFPGPRVTLIEGTPDNATPVIEAALASWNAGDAHIVVTAGQLAPRAKLRKLFETHPEVYAAPLYDDPPTREELYGIGKDAGLASFTPDAAQALLALSHTISRGELRRMVEKLALYKSGDTTPVSAEDVTTCAPLSNEAAVDDVLHTAAEGRTGDIGPILRRLADQGIAPVTMCIQATQHFRTLHSAACDAGGTTAGLARSRPPVFGPRRERMAAQAKSWGRAKLETALGLLTQTDLQLRSPAQTAPAREVMERTLIRISMLNRR